MTRLSPIDAFLTQGLHTGRAQKWVWQVQTRLSRQENGPMLEAFVDAPIRHRQMTVFPVVAPEGPVLPYLLSTAIVGSGVLTLRERGDDATPMVLARNNSLHHLLIPAGESLPGESRARVTGRSFLLAGKSVNQLPASSAERGGWLPPKQEAEVTEWLNHFPLRRNQVGALSFLGSHLVSLEAFGGTNLYQQVHRKHMARLVRSALRAGEEVSDGDDTQGHVPLSEAARAFLELLEEADREEARRVGLGRYWLLKGQVSGGELVHEGSLVHLSARLALNPAGVTAGKEG